MFNPIDFLDVVRFLESRRGEAYVRTAMNRSYYTLFLYLREFLSTQGVPIPSHEEKSVHQYVKDCLKECVKSLKAQGPKWDSETRLVYKVSMHLDTLHQHRTHADYRLDLRIAEEGGKDCLRHVETAIQDFQQLKPDTQDHFVRVAYSLTYC